MKNILLLATIAACLSSSCARAVESSAPATVVHFESAGKTLGGELYLPAGKGPFPAILYNHGSAPGMLNSQASQAIGPLFAKHGWAFFMPYRRGQGLSADAGTTVVDDIAAARATGGVDGAAAKLVERLGGDQLQDQLAALAWLKTHDFVQPDRIATAGNSFGGIEAVLGAAQAPYCAAVDASGGAESWAEAPALQALMKNAVRESNAPVLFFQAKNDFDLSPSQVLSAEMTKAGKTSALKIYPAYGSSARDGHSFAYRGSAVWFDDVLAFVNTHCAPPVASTPAKADDSH